MEIKRRETFALFASVGLVSAICSRVYARGGSWGGDNSDALIDIFAAMAKTGRGYLPGGTYKVSKPLVIPPGVLDGGDVILDFRSADPADFPKGNCVLVQGEPRKRLPDLLRDLPMGGRRLSFSAPHGLRADESFQLSGTVDFAGNGYRRYYRKGEMFHVAEVLDATRLVIKNACRDHYPADGTEVWKRAGSGFTQGCASLTIFGHDGIDYTARFEGLDQSTVSNLRCEKGKLAALAITDCYRVLGENVRARQDASVGRNPYGCIVGNSQDVRLRGEAYGHFNGFTIGGGRTTGGKIGINRDVHFEGKAGSHPTAGLSGGNIHGNSEYCSLRGSFDNGVSLGGDKNEAHGEFRKSGGPPIVFSEMHGHDFKISGTLQTTGSADLAANVGALHQSGYGTHARYGGVTEISLQVYAPKATRILWWRPSDLARTDVELRISLDIMKAHPKTRIIALKKNGDKGGALPLIELRRLNLVDDSVPILWSVDGRTRFAGAGVRAMKGHR